ncbi:MAG: hypothetical protein IJZ89_04265 [Clostridia bacterium]|nr:hypothetical protein [Clostridia bacterium]
MKILFIGNSLTYYNDMPEVIFSAIAKACGKEAEVTSITKGGYHLYQFADENNEYGAKVKSAFENNKYDIVIIQEYGRYPITEPRLFQDAVRKLYKMITANGAQTYLYEPCALSDGHPELIKFGKDMPEMEMKLRAAYADMGKELDIPVCYAGAAISYASENSDVRLYKDDKLHPDLCGSTIAALTIFSKIFGIDPANIDVSIENVSDSDMIELKKAASYIYKGNF